MTISLVPCLVNVVEYWKGIHGKRNEKGVQVLIGDKFKVRKTQSKRKYICINMSCTYEHRPKSSRIVKTLNNCTNVHFHQTVIKH